MPATGGCDSLCGFLLFLWIIYIFFFYNPASVSLPPSWPSAHNCVAPLHTLRFHGQNLFDEQLYRTYFKDTCGGTFVEVGANDGETLSQSLFFEDQLGWRGVCIEPQPEKYKELAKRRPKCFNVNAGISLGEEGSEMTFVKIVGYSDMLSSFEQYITPEGWKRINEEVARYNQTIERIPVRVMPLFSLLSVLKLSSIDYMSIDTEGNEYEVLQTIDWINTDIRLLFIESGPRQKDQKIRKMLTNLRYTERSPIGHNLVFTRMPVT